MTTVPSVAVCLIVKNEKNTIEKTLKSAHVNAGVLEFLVVDTGSTDDTVAVTEAWAAGTPGAKVHIYHETFVDFSTTRNAMLRLALLHVQATYLLLLDANEEVIVNDASQLAHLTDLGYLVPYLLGTLEFESMRLVRNVAGWAYKYPVHEVIMHRDLKHDRQVEQWITLTQQRTPADSESTTARWPKDLAAINEALKADPTEPRMQFYKAQTLACMGRKADAVDAYEVRARNPNGYSLERVQAMAEIGKLAPFSRSRQWLLQAWIEFQAMEAALIISEHARDNKWWETAYEFGLKATTAKKRIMFAQSDDYSYRRWHNLARVAWYVGEFEIGEQAARTALAARPSSVVDQTNLSWYLRQNSKP
jgi:tetratricopeptide (TPR) repeat protein